MFYNQNVISHRISQPEPNPKTQTTKLNSAEAPIAQKVPICQMHTLLDTPGSKHNTNTTAQHRHLQTTTQPPIVYHFLKVGRGVREGGERKQWWGSKDKGRDGGRDGWMEGMHRKDGWRKGMEGRDGWDRWMEERMGCRDGMDGWKGWMDCGKGWMDCGKGWIEERDGGKGWMGWWEVWMGWNVDSQQVPQLFMNT